MVKSCGAYLGNLKEPIDIINQPLWNNYFTEIEKKPFYWKPGIDSGILYIEDIINNGDFLSNTEFCQKFHFFSNFINSYSVLSAIPKNWMKF